VDRLSAAAAMGCGASRDRAVSVQQSDASGGDLLPIGLAAAAAARQPAGAQRADAAPPQAAAAPPLVFAGPTQADRHAVPPSPCCSERSLDMFVVGEDMSSAETPTPVRKSKALCYSPSAGDQVEVREPPKLQQSDRERTEVAEQLLRGQQLLEEAQASLAAAGHRPLVQQPPSPSAERFASRLASRYPDAPPSTTARPGATASPWKERAARGPAVVSPATLNGRRERVAPSGFRISRAEPPAPEAASLVGEPQAHLEAAAATRQAAARRVQLDLPNFDEELDTLAQLEAMLRVGSTTLQPPTRYHHEEAQQFREVLTAEPTARVSSLRGAEAELDALMRREMELLDEGRELLGRAEVDMARALVDSNDGGDGDEDDVGRGAEHTQSSLAPAAYSFEPSNSRQEQRPRATSTVVRELPDASRPRQALEPIGQAAPAPVSLPRVARSRRALAPLHQNAPASLAGSSAAVGKAALQPKALGRRGVQSRQHPPAPRYGDEENLIPAGL
jgi:hypothetical protein